MNENYKNYEKIIQSDFLNVPYKSHKWDRSREAKLVRPGVLNFNRICTTKGLGYMAYHAENGLYYFTDKKEALLKFVDEKFNLKIDQEEVDGKVYFRHVIGVNPGKLLKWPVAIGVNSLGHIFIGNHGDDDTQPSIVIFDAELNTLTVINHKLIKKPSCMEIEEIDENKFRLYITDWWSSNFTVWEAIFNPETREYVINNIKHINVISPSSIRVDEKHVIVVSEVSWDWKDDENKKELLPEDIHYYKREIGGVKHGLNAILIYDKESFETVKTIELVNHLNPRGLHIDEQGRIYTTAYQLSIKADADNRPDMGGIIEQYFAITEENAHTNVHTDRVTLLSTYNSQRFNDRGFSEDMYLLVLDKDGTILQETNLGIEYIGDFLVIKEFDRNIQANRNKILFMSQSDEPALHLMEFRKA